jgi:hypothetical protein
MAAVQWWVIPEASSSNLNGSFVVVSGTAAQIQAKYGSVAQGPFSSKAAAQAQAANEPGISGNPGTAIKQGVQAAASDVLSASGVNVGSWLVRIGETVLGIVLLAIGLARITRAVPVATKIAKTAGAGALLA